MRYEIHGGREVAFEEVGCPSGTTLLSAISSTILLPEKKFLKSKKTEGNYIQDLILRYSLCKTKIRFTFIADGKTKIQTNGDDQLKTNIFYNYGSDLTKHIVELSSQSAHAVLSGYIGTP